MTTAGVWDVMAGRDGVPMRAERFGWDKVGTEGWKSERESKRAGKSGAAEGAERGEEGSKCRRDVTPRQASEAVKPGVTAGRYLLQGL